MPAWIHDRAQHIRKKNPGMSESQSFAIATQQSHATGHTPKGYGTPEGKRAAKKKYDAPKSEYVQTADPSSKSKTSSLALLMRSSGSPPGPRTDGDSKMKSKLAGSLPLQDAIARTIEEAREKMKIAADSSKDEKVRKLVAYEKKEHGHIPSEKEEADECKDKKSSAIDPFDPDEVTKLAEALDSVSEKLASGDMGGESAQGGQTLADQKPTGGTQPYKKDGSKRHNIPMTPGKERPSDAPGTPANAVATDEKNRLGGTYPAKGVLKTGGVAALESVVEKVSFAVTEKGHKFDAEKAKHREEYHTKRTEHLQKHRAIGYNDPDTGTNPAKFRGALRFGGEGDPRWEARHDAYVRGKHERGRNAYNPFGGSLTPTKAEKGGKAGFFGHFGRVGKHDTAKKALEEKNKKKEKKSSVEDPVSYILNKISGADLGGESPQGGQTLPSTMPVKMQPGRSLIQNKDGIKNVTKREAKAPRKAELAEVLTEPAFSKAHDSKVHENLRSATKGGVKIAAAKAFLQKVAEEGCKCESAGTCRHCQMKEKASAMMAGASTKGESVETSSTPAL